MVSWRCRPHRTAARNALTPADVEDLTPRQIERGRPTPASAMSALPTWSTGHVSGAGLHVTEGIKESRASTGSRNPLQRRSHVANDEACEPGVRAGGVDCHPLAS